MRIISLLLFCILSACTGFNDIGSGKNVPFYVLYSANNAMQVEELRYMTYTVMRNNLNMEIKTINLNSKKAATELSNLQNKKVNFILIDNYKKFTNAISEFNLNYNLFSNSNKILPDEHFIDLSKNDNTSLESAFLFARENNYARIALLLDYKLQTKPDFIPGQEVVVFSGINQANLNNKLNKLEEHFMEMAGRKDTSAVFINMKNIPFTELEKVANRLDIAGVNIKLFIFNSEEPYRGSNHMFANFNNDTVDLFTKYVVNSPKEFANMQMTEVTSTLKNMCILNGIQDQLSKSNSWVKDKNYINSHNIQFTCLDMKMFLNKGKFGIILH